MKLNIPQAAALALALAAPLASHAAGAMRVVLDPKTGEMRAPNAAEAAAYERAEAQLRAARAQQGGATAKPVVPREIRYADGTIENVLGEDTHLYSVVSTDAQGNLGFDCLPAQEARQYVKAGGRAPLAKRITASKSTKVAQ